MRSLHDYRISICCLSETRIPGTCHKSIKVPGSDAFYHLYYSGPTDGSSRNGVALALDSNANETLRFWEPISSRIALARFKAKPTGLSVICAYAPTLPSDVTAKDSFYEELQKAVDRVPRRDILIVAGDWNAGTGKADTGTQRVIGNFGLGQRCENGDRVLNIAEYNRLVIANTRFQHLKHLLTWYSNDERTAHQTDHILVRARWSYPIEDCRSYRGAETRNMNCTDDVLLRAKIHKANLLTLHSGDYLLREDKSAPSMSRIVATYERQSAARSSQIRTQSFSQRRVP